MATLIQPIKKSILPILKRNKVKRASIFGSYARGVQKKKSDIDIIIEPPKGMGLGFVGIKLELEEKLGKKVVLYGYSQTFSDAALVSPEQVGFTGKDDPRLKRILDEHLGNLQKSANVLKTFYDNFTFRVE